MEEDKKDPFEKMVMVEETFATVFKDAVHLETKTVKVGGTSGNVYVPKRFGGYPVTIIIWNKPEGVENGRGTADEPSDNGTELQVECKEEL